MTTDLALTRHQLERLPRLARQADTEPRTTTTDTTPAGHRGGRLGPRLPAGVASVLSDLDQGRERPDQLARISQCVRAVQEELDLATLPDPGPEATWAGECRWLLATAAQWSRDPWCAEWIATEVADVERALVDRIHANTGRCAICDTSLEVRTIGPLASAICPACDRVASMRLTTSPERADRWRQDRIIDGARKLLGLDTKPS